MENTVDFKCEGENLEQIPDSIISRTGITFPKAHTDKAMMALLATEISRYKGDAICRIPFCVTTKAEALGAVINLGDQKTGPRVKEYAYSSLEEMTAMTVMDLGTGRIKEVLDCVEKLAEAGETVALTVEGPFTIISSLIDPLHFYKGMRKDRESVDQVLNVVEESIANYILEGIRRGAKIISYGDPVGAVDIVGPKVYEEFSGKSSYRILKRIENNMGSAIVHLCGKTSTAFTRLGFAEASAVQFEGDLTYGEAIVKMTGENSNGSMIGHQCIKKTPFLLKTGVVWEIKLK